MLIHGVDMEAVELAVHVVCVKARVRSGRVMNCADVAEAPHVLGIGAVRRPALRFLGLSRHGLFSGRDAAAKGVSYDFLVEEWGGRSPILLLTRSRRWAPGRSTMFVWKT